VVPSGGTVGKGNNDSDLSRNPSLQKRFEPGWFLGVFAKVKESRISVNARKLVGEAEMVGGEIPRTISALSSASGKQDSRRQKEGVKSVAGRPLIT